MGPERLEHARMARLRAGGPWCVAAGLSCSRGRRPRRVVREEERTWRRSPATLTPTSTDQAHRDAASPSPTTRLRTQAACAPLPRDLHRRCRSSGPSSSIPTPVPMPPTCPGSTRTSSSSLPHPISAAAILPPSLYLWLIWSGEQRRRQWQGCGEGRRAPPGRGDLERPHQQRYRGCFCISRKRWDACLVVSSRKRLAC